MQTLNTRGNEGKEETPGKNVTEKIGWSKTEQDAHETVDYQSKNMRNTLRHRLTKPRKQREERARDESQETKKQTEFKTQIIQEEEH